jgi:Protein of unknown function (DUF4235)
MSRFRRRQPPGASIFGAAGVWRIVSTLIGLGSAMLTRQLLSKLWGRLSSGPEPPLNPADRRISWAQALAWGIAGGVGAGIARTLGERSAAAGWERVVGGAPPGIRPEN